MVQAAPASVVVSSGPEPGAQRPVVAVSKPITPGLTFGSTGGAVATGDELQCAPPSLLRSSEPLTCTVRVCAEAAPTAVASAVAMTRCGPKVAPPLAEVTTK